MSAPSKTCPMSAWMAAGPVTWTSTPSGASSRSWLRSSSTLSMLSVLEAETTGTATIAAVLSSDTTTGDCWPSPPPGGPPCDPPWDPPGWPGRAVRCAVRGALSIGRLGGLRQQGGPLLGQLVLGRLVELAGVSGPQHDGDLALVVGQLFLELDRQGAVGADGQRVQGRGFTLALRHERDHEIAKRIGTIAKNQASLRPAIARAGAGVWWEGTTSPRGDS